MAFSWQEEVVPAGTTDLNVNIEYLDKSYINVYLDRVLTTDYYWVSDSLLRLNSAVMASTTVTIVRRTDKEFLYIKFADGAAFIKENLDTQNTQFLHLAQEMVEGRSIDGFYGSISMNGYRITNLAPGINAGDAVNKSQLDSVSDRVSGIEDSFVGITTVSYPWYSVVLESTDTLSPPYTFDKASLYINGQCQIPEYSYVVVDNTILLAEPVPTGTIVFARLGEDTDSATDMATATALAAVQVDLQNKLDALSSTVTGLSGAVTDNTESIGTLTTQLGQKAAAGANSDITSLSGLTTALSVAQGGTGGTTAAAARSGLGLSNLALTGTAATGTPDTAAFSADTTLTFSAAYSQAEHTTAAAWIKRIAQRVLLLENVIRNNSIQKV